MSYFNSLIDFFHYPFLGKALIGTFLLSSICGLLSPFILAKKYAFIGEGISHSTFLGLSIGLALIPPENYLGVFAITLGITLFIVTFLSHATYQEKLPSDSLIGIFLTVSLACGVLIHTLFVKTKGDLLSVLFGNILLLESFDLLLLFGLLVVILGSILLPLKRWIYIIFDEQGALVSGVNLKVYHYYFYFLLTLVIVSSIKLAGTILVNALLLMPGAYAFKMAHNIRKVFIHSLSLSVLSSLIGLSLANWQNLPPGATLALTQFVFFITITNIQKLRMKSV